MQTLNAVITAAALLVAAPLSLTAQAQGMDHGSMPGMSMGQPAAAATTEGEVRNVDKDNQTITLKHGTIENLNMLGMTMVFKVRDAAMLDSFKAGDKVRFKAEKADGAILVTALELAP